MTLSMFQAPAVGLREAKTEGETSLSATEAEVTSPADDVKRLGEQIRFFCLLADPHGTRPCVHSARILGERKTLF